MIAEDFNSHPHEEDDQSELCNRAVSKLNFNSHPHEEDDNGRHGRGSGKIHFNSHPHEEDDSNFKQK